VALAIAIVATMAAFYRVRRRAAFLLVPYLAWVVFAATLNLAVWRLNPP
jgi:benzodiazapine receptor